jgi:hypothetical protein
MPHSELIPAPGLPRIVLDQERPVAKDLSPYFPVPCNQGSLASCAAWVGGYALMSYLAATNVEGWENINLKNRQFSPTFVFNQSNAVAAGRSESQSCKQVGSYMSDVLVLLRDVGCVTWDDVPYTEDDCSAPPSADEIERAGRFRIRSFLRTTPEVDTVRTYIDADVPVLCVLRLGEQFQRLGPGDIYDEVETQNTYAHAVMAVGYDDGLRAIKIMNSWGTQWGDFGFGLIDYEIWPFVAVETYVVDSELVTEVESVEDITSPQASEASAQETGSLPTCGLNPLRDTDGDGLPDGLERLLDKYGFDPLVPDDTDALPPIDDTDGDGWPEKAEIIFQTDPADETDYPFDCDYQYPDSFFDPKVVIVTSWRNPDRSVEVDIGWTLPSGEQVQSEQGDFVRNSAAVLRRPTADVPDGFHWLTFDGRLTSHAIDFLPDLLYGVSFLDYSFRLYRVAEDAAAVSEVHFSIGLDVVDGKASAVFTSWVERGDPPISTPTGARPVEMQAAWWNADSPDVEVNISLVTPSGETVDRFDHGDGVSGFERIPLLADVDVVDGTYSLGFEFLSADAEGAASADIAFDARFLDYGFERRQRATTGTSHLIELEVMDGVVVEVSNSWPDVE